MEFRILALRNIFFTDKICGFSSKTDCDTVLSSKASRLFGWINWADAGLIYFIGTFIYLAGSGERSSLGILAVISAASIPYPIFSIYYQSVKIKKWCTFCLMVQFVLISEFVILFQVLTIMSFSGIDVLRLSVSFLIPAAIWVLFKAYYQKSDDLILEHNSFMRFKRDPDIFRLLLKGSEYSEIAETDSTLVVGNFEAPIVINAFMSLYCDPCAKAFKELKALIESCPDVKINFIFPLYGDAATQKVINTLCYLNAEKDTGAILNILAEWYLMPKQSRKTIFTKHIIPENYNQARQTGEKNQQLFENSKIAATPTVFVNGYRFPIQYEYSDIQFYIDDIIKLTKESIRQEA